MRDINTPKRCVVPGCGEPRMGYPSGRTVPRCRRHEAERVYSIKRRPTVDPATGETLTRNALAIRRWRAKGART